jgi:hypothetical protein
MLVVSTSCLGAAGCRPGGREVLLVSRRAADGVTGAELMRSIPPEPPPMASEAPEDGVEIALVADTKEGLTELCDV